MQDVAPAGAADPFLSRRQMRRETAAGAGGMPTPQRAGRPRYGGGSGLPQRKSSSAAAAASKMLRSGPFSLSLVGRRPMRTVQKRGARTCRSMGFLPMMNGCPDWRSGGPRPRSPVGSTGWRRATSATAGPCAKECVNGGSTGDPGTRSGTRWRARSKSCSSRAEIRGNNRRTSSGPSIMGRITEKGRNAYEAKSQHFP